jgi:hypothetical protein
VQAQQQQQQGSGGRRWVWIVVGVVVAVGVLGVVRGLVASGDDPGGGGGAGGGCADPTFVVDVKTFTDEPVDPINVPDMHDVALEGTVTMTGEHPVNVGSVVVPMASSPEALVYGSLEDPILEPGVAVPFSARGPVELTGSPVVIPDDTAAEVSWQYEDAAHYSDC